MSLSLRDQLLQAGLVTEERVRKVERELAGHKSTRPPRPGSRRAPPTSPVPRKMTAPSAPSAPKPNENKARKLAEKAARRATYEQIRQLVTTHQVPRVETDDYYNFQDELRIARIPVTPPLRASLVNRELAIVRCDGRYAFVPLAVGEQIGTLAPKALSHIYSPSSISVQDYEDPKYAVPDDLVW